MEGVSGLDTLRAETREKRVNVPRVGEGEGAKAAVVFDVQCCRGLLEQGPQ
jgi:hypothetical protein